VDYPVTLSLLQSYYSESLQNVTETFILFFTFTLYRPVEVLQSNKEYTEEDITDEVLKGRSVPYSSSDRGVFDFPGLRNDMEVMERNLFGGLSRFLESAEGMTNDFFDAFGKSPRIFDAESSSPSVRRGIPNARRPEASKTQEKESGDTDYVSLAQDV